LQYRQAYFAGFQRDYGGWKPPLRSTKMNSPHHSRVDTTNSTAPAPLVSYREPVKSGQTPELALDSILAALEGIQYGHLVVSIQDGQLIQIDRTERFRMVH
jgi:hypothetical protein